MGVNVSDEMWLRILDGGLALESRTYRGSGMTTFELTDDFCPWNTGTWRLTVADGGAGTTVAAEAGAEADIALDVSALSTITWVGSRSRTGCGGSGYRVARGRDRGG